MRARYLPVALSFPVLLAAQDSARVVSPGTSVRVHVGLKDAITGRAVSSTDSSLTLRTMDGVETLRYRLIQRTELRRGSAGKFAAIAGAVGATVGVTAAIVFKDFGCDHDGCESSPAIAGGIFFGGAPAAVIGAFVGAVTPRWKTQPGRVSVLAPEQVQVEPGSLLARHECAPGANGNLDAGIASYGTLSLDAGLVINCQPGRTVSITTAFVDLPDRTSGIGDLYKTNLSRVSLGAERFVVGGLRASFSIDGYREAGTRHLGSSTQGVVDGGVGFGLGLSAARPVTRSLALRGAVQMHARPNSNRDPESTLFFGIERSARQR